MAVSRGSIVTLAGGKRVIVTRIPSGAGWEVVLETHEPSPSYRVTSLVTTLDEMREILQAITNEVTP